MDVIRGCCGQVSGAEDGAAAGVDSTQAAQVDWQSEAAALEGTCASQAKEVCQPNMQLTSPTAVCTHAEQG